MKYNFGKITIALLALQLWSADAATGKCPTVGLANISNLSKIMTTWWRPFRSDVPGQGSFKCLTTEFAKLRTNETTGAIQFDVTDFNVDAKSSVKTNWTGTVTTVKSNTDWFVQFDQSQGM